MTKAPPRPGQTSGITSYRPVISARRHVVSAGHYLAAHAGFAVLEAGGNAIDAGVAAGIALGVLQSDLVNVAGVAPIILYHAESRKVFTVSGLGPWPKRVTPDYFMKHHGGKIPRGLLRTVVPAAPDAWIQTLQRWGSMSFGDVAAASVRFAKEGFAAHPLLCETIDHAPQGLRGVAVQPGNLPAERPPAAGGRDLRPGRSRQEPAVHDRRGAGGGAQGSRRRPRGGALGLLHRRHRPHDRCLPRAERRPVAHGRPRRIPLGHRGVGLGALRRVLGAHVRAVVPGTRARADAAPRRGEPVATSTPTIPSTTCTR